MKKARNSLLKRQNNNLEGRRYGRLLVIERAENHLYPNMWRVICDCGTEKILRGSNIKSRRTKSCGCLRREKAPLNRKNRPGRNIQGLRFGSLTVIKRIEKTSASRALVKCDCGNQKAVFVGKLYSGIKSCGCGIPPRVILNPPSYSIQDLSPEEILQMKRILCGRTAKKLVAQAVELVILDRPLKEMLCHGGTELRL